MTNFEEYYGEPLFDEEPLSNEEDKEVNGEIVNPDEEFDKNDDTSSLLNVAPFHYLTKKYDPKDPEANKANSLFLDRSGTLMKNVMDVQGYSSQFINSYNHWICGQINKQISYRNVRKTVDYTNPANGITTTITKVIKLNNAHPRPTMIKVNEGGVDVIRPIREQDALDRKIDYSIDLWANRSVVTYQLMVNNDGTSYEREIQNVNKEVLIGKIPLMIGSRIVDPLSNTVREDFPFGVDKSIPLNDPGAYFIVKGMKYFMLTQDMLRIHKTNTTKGKGTKKGYEVQASIVILTLRGSTKPSVIIESSHKKGDGGTRKVKEKSFTPNFYMKKPDGFQLVISLSFLGKKEEDTKDSEIVHKTANLKEVLKLLIYFHLLGPKSKEDGFEQEIDGNTWKDHLDNNTLWNNIEAIVLPHLINLTYKSSRKSLQRKVIISIESMMKILKDGTAKSPLVYFAEKFPDFASAKNSDAQNALLLFNNIISIITPAFDNIGYDLPKDKLITEDLMKTDRIMYRVFTLLNLTINATEVFLDIEPQTNKNLYENKSNRIAGRNLFQLFMGMINYEFEDLRKKLDRVSIETLRSSILTDIDRIINGSDSTDSPDGRRDGFPRSDRITTTFRTSFTTMKWGIRGLYIKDTTMKEPYEEQSVLQKYSLITKITIRGSGLSSNTELRAVQYGQWGHICVAETPERKRCGQVKHFAITAFSTWEDRGLELLNYIERQNLITTFDDNGEESKFPLVGLDADILKDGPRLFEILTKRLNDFDYSLICLNGTVVGFNDPNKTLNGVIAVRRGYVGNTRIEGSSSLFPQISVVYRQRLEGTTSNDKGVYIYADVDRPLRPLVVVNPETNRPYIYDAIEKEGYDTVMKWTDRLFNEGYVEYICPDEFQTLTVSVTLDDLDFVNKRKLLLEDNLTNLTVLLDAMKGSESAKDIMLVKRAIFLHSKEIDYLSKKRYTHSEIDPQAMLGFSAASIPFVGMAQAIRGPYQAKMGPQAMGVADPNYMKGSGVDLKVLANPQIPFTNNQINRIIGDSNLGTGNIINAAFTSYEGFTDEDAVVVNRNVADSFVFGFVSYDTYTAVTERDKEIEIGRREGVSDNHKYKYITSDGLPMIGALLEPGMVVIAMKPTKGVKDAIVDHSVTVEKESSGFVHMVKRVSNDSVIVVLKRLNKTETGNKLAFRIAQKATIGAIRDPEDMPRLADGTIIDVLVNPHCIPSRMTTGLLLEVLLGKFAAREGLMFDSTNFRPYEIEKMLRAVHPAGLSPIKQKLYKPNGEALDGEVFAGPVYHTTLKHIVRDKFNARAFGPKSMQTLQATKGRNKNGGMKIGEMERDSIVVHGLYLFTQDRFITAGDGFSALYCLTCGNYAMTTSTDADEINNSITPVCKTCRSDSKSIIKLELSYAFIIMQELLKPIGINVFLVE